MCQTNGNHAICLSKLFLLGSETLQQGQHANFEGTLKALPNFSEE